MKCSSCGTEMQDLGGRRFRVGGTGGGWKLLFGEWAELGEDLIELQLHVCPACRKDEFYAPVKEKGKK